MNNTVDARAKECVKTQWKKQLSIRERIKNKRTKNINMLLQFHHMWHEINRCALDANKSTRNRRDVNTIPALPMPIDEARLQVLHCHVETGTLAQCPFGGLFAERVVKYFAGLSWDFSAPSVSLLELYIDFCLSTGTLAPVLLDSGTRGPRGKMIQHYYLPDRWPAADGCSQLLSTQHSIWMRTIRWLLKVWDGNPFGEVICNSRTAHRYGFLEKRILGLTGYPRLRSGIAAGEKLWHFFHPPSGVHRSLRLTWGRNHIISAGGG